MYGAQQLADDNVERAAAGGDADRARIAEALEAQVRAMVTARLSPHPGQFDAAEEIAQQAMVAVVESLPRLTNRTVGGLRSLVSVIVARRVADFLRGKKRSKLGGRHVASLDSTVANRSSAGPLWQFLSGSWTSPLSAAARAEQTARLLTELDDLKPAYRSVITLAFFDGLAMRDVGAQLGMSREAASMLLRRAVRALGENMVKREPIEVTDDGRG